VHSCKPVAAETVVVRVPRIKIVLRCEQLLMVKPQPAEARARSCKPVAAEIVAVRVPRIKIVL
jgi:hypothetical protein